MKQFRHNGTNNWPSILTRIALVLTSVTIIVLFLPRDSSRILHYSEGQPWTDGALIAPIDFPVFNVADIGITLGVVLALFGYMFLSPAAREVDATAELNARDEARAKRKAQQRGERARKIRERNER